MITIYTIIIFLIISFIIYYFSYNNDMICQHNDNHVDNHVDKHVETILSKNEKIKNINDIFYSDTQNLFSETTNKLIGKSYDELLNTMYRTVIFSFNFIGTNNKEYDVPICLTLFKDNVLTDNYIELLKYYGSCSVFKFDENFGCLFTGDYLNNNGSTNLNANRTILQISEQTLPKFIPANSISMIGIKKNSTETNDLFIGSIFVMNLFDITEQSYIQKYNLLPFGKFNISNDNFSDRLLIDFFKLKTNNHMRIKNITEKFATIN